MAEYLSLEEAAKQLGIPTEKLVDMRSQGEIRGFKDGSSWKFPTTEIERLADELGVDMGLDLTTSSTEGTSIEGDEGSAILIDDAGLGSSIGTGSGSIIGGDSGDLGIGSESVEPGSGGSDVNLVADAGDGGSDVALIATDSSIGSSIEVKKPAQTNDSELDLLIEDDPLPEIDSKELKLDGPAITHDSGDEIDLGSVATEGSTGPTIDLKEGSTGPTIASKDGSTGPTIEEDPAISSLNIGAEPEDELAIGPESDLSFTGAIPDEDSDEVMIGVDDEESDLDALASDIKSGRMKGGPGSGPELSSLELMDELDSPVASPSKSAAKGSSGADVLSELDLLAESGTGSGLISGDSGNVLGSSLGSSLGDDVLGGMDDALSDEDDLVIAEDDHDLVIDSSGTDISVAGDSGINLMSPSDSGLSLESEPLDLAGSSISALDLGAELSDGSDPSDNLAAADSDGSGSMVEFQADEEFQLSPSGIGLEADFESGSQEIEIEDSEAIGEAVEFGEADGGAISDAFGTDDAGGFGGGLDAEPVEAVDAVEEDPVSAGLGLETTSARRPGGAAISTPGTVGYEVPFTLMQCLVLLSIVFVMTLGGMLMTDLIRNMWTYQEGAAPVSSLTNALIELMGLN